MGMPRDFGGRTDQGPKRLRQPPRVRAGSPGPLERKMPSGSRSRMRLSRHRPGNRRDPAADVDQVAEDVPLHAEVEGDDVRSPDRSVLARERARANGAGGVLIDEIRAVQAKLPGERLARHHLARQVAADQAGALPGLVHQAGVVQVGGGENSLHRPLDPGQANQGSGVDSLEADDAVPGQERIERLLCTEVAGPAAQLANHESPDPGATALPILVIDPVVADLGIGHGHDLAMIGGVGEDLLVSRHARVEDDLAIDLAPGAEGPAGEDRSVLECEFRYVHRQSEGLYGPRSRSRMFAPGFREIEFYTIKCSCVECCPRGSRTRPVPRPPGEGSEQRPEPPVDPAQDQPRAARSTTMTARARAAACERDSPGPSARITIPGPTGRLSFVGASKIAGAIPVAASTLQSTIDRPGMSPGPRRPSLRARRRPAPDSTAWSIRRALCLIASGRSEPRQQFRRQVRQANAQVEHEPRSSVRIHDSSREPHRGPRAGPLQARLEPPRPQTSQPGKGEDSHAQHQRRNGRGQNRADHPPPPCGQGEGIAGSPGSQRQEHQYYAQAKECGVSQQSGAQGRPSSGGSSRALPSRASEVSIVGIGFRARLISASPTTGSQARIAPKQKDEAERHRPGPCGLDGRLPQAVPWADRA